ncbi:MAG: ABC transporter permease [Candidatus Hodarchaeales archaeon]|jgi:ABC-type Na+ efflux pump permease subunit
MMPAVQIAIKEFRLLFRSKRRIFWLFSTTFLIFALGVLGGVVFIFVGDGEPTLLIAGANEEFEGENRGGIALKQLCEIQTEENFTVIALEAVDRRLKEKNFDIMVVLPLNFTGLLVDNNTAVNATVTVYYDAGDITSLRMAAEVEIAIAQLNSAIVYQTYSIEKSVWVAPDLDNVAEGVGELGAAVLSMIPLYGMLLLAMPAVSLTLISVTIEREQKTLEPLLLSRISRRSIVWGKLLYGLLLIGITLGLNIISMIVGILIFTVMSGSELSSIIEAGEEFAEFIELDLISASFLAVGLIVVSMLLVAACVLLSFLAKDEREGQMLTSAVIGVPAVCVVAFLFLPVADFPLWLKLAFAITPLFGFLLSTFYVFLEGGKINLTTAVGLMSQIVWLILVIWTTARLIESEGVLEISIIQVLSLKNLRSRFNR